MLIFASTVEISIQQLGRV